MNMKKTMHRMESKWTSASTADIQFMSLYDYLGTAAGSTLGKEVAIAASRAGIPVTEKHVSNKKYTGKILMYPKYFLQEYFNKSKTKRYEY